jgi:hypothetical protein
MSWGTPLRTKTFTAQQCFVQQPSKYSSTQSLHSEMFYAEKTTNNLKEGKNRKDTGLNTLKKDWVI